MFNDNMPAKIGHGFIKDGFADLAGIHTEDFVMGHKGRLIACKIPASGAVGEDDAGGLAGRRDSDRRDVAATMKAPATVAGPAGLAEVGIDAGAGEELIRCSEKLPVRRWPGDDNSLVCR